MSLQEKLTSLVDNQNSQIAARTKAAADLAEEERQVAEPSVETGRLAIRDLRKLQKEFGPILEMAQQLIYDELLVSGRPDTAVRFRDVRDRLARGLDDQRIRDIESQIKELLENPKSIAAGNLRYMLECSSGAADNIRQNVYQLELMIDGLNDFRTRAGKSPIVGWAAPPNTERAPGTKPNVKTEYDVFDSKG